MSFKERWEKEKELWKRFWTFVIIPTFFSLIPFAIGIALLEFTQKQNLAAVFIYVGIIGTNVLWLRGFHKGGFLTKGSTNYIWNRIVYGLFWIGLLYGVVFGGFLVLALLQKN